MKTIDNEPFEEKQSTELAIGSFIIITLLFILYILSDQSPNVLIIAWPFALSAIIVNAIMLFHLTEKFIHLPLQRRDIAVKILILLSNIPIAFFYYLLVMKN
ncbi:hypothetical protein ASE21_10335 [Flavobacterium sp. Root901]|uniref:hypothetical protein n=1 Tax=Flavobacterium sp. Root901 TaxID=1736605 RepID=UPI00070E0687|nr:hypothetical protein [Flavobacterium sp. Root901]KRD10110.1 hypothetical protein ASE21_10335 [Flavobacterium sp. Root901]